MLLEQNEEWAVQWGRYVTREIMATLSDAAVADWPPWPSDRSGPNQKPRRPNLQLHHALGHDPYSPIVCLSACALSLVDLAALVLSALIAEDAFISACPSAFPATRDESSLIEASRSRRQSPTQKANIKPLPFRDQTACGR
jgi:hypothetical protein